jgi:hypothetical protein
MFHCGSLDGRARDGVERQGCVDVVDGVQNLQRIKETVFADKKERKVWLLFIYRNNQFW